MGGINHKARSMFLFIGATFLLATIGGFYGLLGSYSQSIAFPFVGIIGFLFVVLANGINDESNDF